METPGQDPHALLPWYVNATLDAGERAAFETHLPGCVSCREELLLLRALRDAVRRHGEDFFLPHPEPERLVTELLEGLPEPEGGAVRRHVALCATCAVESRLVREDRARARPPLAGAAPAAPWRRIVPWAAAAAVVAGVAVGLWQRPGPAVRPSEIVEAYYVEPSRRDAGSVVLSVPPSAPGFEIVLPLEITAASLPLTVEILDRSGRTVFLRREVTRVYRDSFLFVHCARAEFPDGEYLARVHPAAPAGQTPSAPFEFRFRVIAD
jgi:hypothetical protein